ncbi:MAG: hypothetical protein CFH00_00431, partial [Alphaproteobacteria bacterium MarineAlpha1_Bin1]
MWTSSKRRLTFLFALALVWPAVVIAPTAQAALEIDITKGNVDPLPVAIPDFYGADA